VDRPLSDASADYARQHVLTVIQLSWLFRGDKIDVLSNSSSCRDNTFHAVEEDELAIMELAR